MKYIVITSKHHDGFAMFDSKADPFNIVDATPFHHDPIARGTVPPYFELRMHKSAVHLLFTFAQVLLFRITIAEHYGLVAQAPPRKRSPMKELLNLRYLFCRLDDRFLRNLSAEDRSMALSSHETE